MPRRAPCFAPRICGECGATYSPTGAAQRYCSHCAATAHARHAKEWGQRNAERVREAKRRYVQRHPDRRRASLRRYARRPAIRERMATLKRGYYARNPARDKAYATRWRRENRERWANTQRRRRERLAGAADGGEAGAVYATIIAGDPCAYCGQRAEAIDHIDPLALGGTGHWDNLTAACKRCNGAKHAHPLLIAMLRAQAVG